MKFRFDDIEEGVTEHLHGGEGNLVDRMLVMDGHRFIKGKLTPGSTVGIHRHQGSFELIMITSGKGRAVCDGKEEVLVPGDCHYCAEGSEHTLINDGDEDLGFYAIVPKLS